LRPRQADDDVLFLSQFFLAEESDTFFQYLKTGTAWKKWKQAMMHYSE